MPFGTCRLPLLVLMGNRGSSCLSTKVVLHEQSCKWLVCRSAAGAFVEVGGDWQVGCHWKPEAPYNVTFLQRKDCSLFARKMSVHAKLQVLRLATSQV